MKKLFIALTFILTASPAHADITWAVAGPYTGPVAVIGLSQQAGIKQAISDINAKGGVNGQKIVAKMYDDVCDPKQAVAVANKIISDNIHLILHGSCSGTSLAALKTYLDEGALVINSVSSNPKITDDGGPLLFRTMLRDDNSATFVADYLLKHYQKSNIAIIHDRSTFGQDIAELVRGHLNQAGVKEVTFEPYDPNNHDYSVIVTRLIEAKADIVFMGGYPVDMALLTRQLREKDPHIQVVAEDLSAPEFWKIAGKMGEGALFTFVADPRKEQGAKDVVAKLTKAGVVVDSYTLYGYAATEALAEAITKASSTDPVKVAAALHEGEFTTILGKWSFDAKGDVRNIHESMYRWHDGQFEELKE
jgi:branched-chain amino acid transport system substrate-binding protein